MNEELPHDGLCLLDGIISVRALEETKLHGRVQLDRWYDVVNELPMEGFG